MRDMKREYGPVKGERIFYATAAKTGQKPRTVKRSLRKVKRA